MDCYYIKPLYYVVKCFLFLGTSIPIHWSAVSRGTGSQVSYTQ